MKCTACQTENTEGAMFCEECGVKLETLSTNSGQAGSISSQQGGAGFALVTTEGNRLEIPAQDDVVIGREDPISEVFPDIDLTSLGGVENGVSRKHALLHRSGAEFTLEDMGSTNGTYVNRKRLLPHAARQIKAGDEVRFGKLALVVH